MRAPCGCRGGSRGLRPFRRGRGETCSAGAEGEHQATAGSSEAGRHARYVKEGKNVAVARVWCMSGWQMCPRVEPEKDSAMACRSGRRNVAVARSCLLADPEGFAHSAAAGGNRQEWQGRRERFDVTFMHVSGPTIIWTYVYACLSAGGDMELRFCISQRRRSYGLTFLHT